MSKKISVIKKKFKCLNSVGAGAGAVIRLYGSAEPDGAEIYIYGSATLIICIVKESHGNWYALPYGDPTAQLLSSQFSVRGIPALKVP
jgi:hypothetical protein